MSRRAVLGARSKDAISAPPPARAQSSLAGTNNRGRRKTRKIARTFASGTAECFASTGMTPRPAVRFGRESLPRSCARRAERCAPVAKPPARATRPSRLTRLMLLRRSGSARKADGVPAPRALDSAAACEDAISSLSVSHEPYGSAVALCDARVCVADARSVCQRASTRRHSSQKAAKYLRRGAKKVRKRSGSRTAMSHVSRIFIRQPGFKVSIKRR